MSYEELSLTGFINEMKDVSVGPHARKFCFVLGAGASITSGIKSGQELVNIWDKELLERNRDSHLKWKKDLKINDSNKYSFYSQYYERRFKRQPMDGYNYLEKLMEHAKPSIGYVMLSYMLTQTEHNVVITTNFDHLTEDAVNYYTQTIPLIIGHETLAHYIGRQIRRPTIIKIHRDLLFDPKNRTDELEKLHKNWEEALGIVFSEYHPVFIGYAGNDKSLMNFLLENKERFSRDEWRFPYWMLYKTDEVNAEVMQFLEATNGYLIKHNGFDKVLYLLGAEFECKLPLKEDFINDAEKRFQMLANAIDEFTEKSIRKEDMPQEEKEPDEEMDQAVRKITNQTKLQGMYRRAVELHNAEKNKEAIELEQQLLEFEPDNARYRYLLGLTLQQMGRYEESLDELQRALELDPDNAEYNYSLGVTFFELDRYNEDLEATRRALEFDPDNAEYHYELGKTLYALERYEEDLRETRKALELDPDNAEYHWSLGCTLKRLKRYKEAQKAMQKALELEPDNEQYQADLEKIKNEKFG